MDNAVLEMRVLYLEKEIEKLQEYIRKLEVKLKINPFTRDSFRDKEINYSSE
jgi:hypothetical protein|tara:strand:- start:144 stop:299 length:156 start_codon:yes stop_codon:yes gene_type:complete